MILVFLMEVGLRQQSDRNVFGVQELGFVVFDDFGFFNGGRLESSNRNLKFQSAM
jgi:hypothetical protein